MIHIYKSIYVMWNAPVTKTAYRLAEQNKKLYWYGITFGNYGIGVLVSKADKQ